MKGIGEKGATDLLQKYGSLGAVYAHLAEVEPDRLKNALTDGKADSGIEREAGPHHHRCTGATRPGRLPHARL